MLTEPVRNRIACYAAAIAIILQQLSAVPRSTVSESPNPLVRVRESMTSDTEWHPDEVFISQSGRRRVLVWDSGDHERDAARFTGISPN